MRHAGVLQRLGEGHLGVYDGCLTGAELLDDMQQLRSRASQANSARQLVVLLKCVQHAKVNLRRILLIRFEYVLRECCISVEDRQRWQQSSRTIS